MYFYQNLVMCQTCYNRGYNDYPEYLSFELEHKVDYIDGYKQKQYELLGPDEAQEVDFCQKCHDNGTNNAKIGIWAPPYTQVKGHMESYEKGYYPTDENIAVIVPLAFAPVKTILPQEKETNKIPQNINKSNAIIATLARNKGVVAATMGTAALAVVVFVYTNKFPEKKKALFAFFEKKQEEDPIVLDSIHDGTQVLKQDTNKVNIVLPAKKTVDTNPTAKTEAHKTTATPAVATVEHKTPAPPPAAAAPITKAPLPDLTSKPVKIIHHKLKKYKRYAHKTKHHSSKSGNGSATNTANTASASLPNKALVAAANPTGTQPTGAASSRAVGTTTNSTKTATTTVSNPVANVAQNIGTQAKQQVKDLQSTKPDKATSNPIQAVATNTITTTKLKIGSVVAASVTSNNPAPVLDNQAGSGKAVLGDVKKALASGKTTVLKKANEKLAIKKDASEEEINNNFSRPEKIKIVEDSRPFRTKDQYDNGNPVPVNTTNSTRHLSPPTKEIKEVTMTKVERNNFPDEQEYGPSTVRQGHYYTFKLEEENRDKDKTNEPYGGKYVVASKRNLNDGDLQALPSNQLNIMLNEIYARHGLIFKDDLLKNYFMQKYWYSADTTDVTTQLTDVEKRNIEFIKKHMK